MEKAKGKKQNSTKSGEESLAGQSQPEEAKKKQQASGETKLQRNSESGTKRKRSMKEEKASRSEKEAQGNGRVRLRKKIPIPPLPPKLPPANVLHRDILRAWCQQLKLSTKGQKLDVYKRICEYAYPDQKKNIPVTAEEAKIHTHSQRRSQTDQGEMSPESSEKRLSSDGTYRPDVAAPSEGGASALAGSDVLLEGVNTVVVTTSAPDAVFASWSRIAARAGKMETVEPPQEAHGVPAADLGWAEVSGGVWSMGEVCLQTQKVGFTCNFMQDKPGCLKNGGEYVLCSCYRPVIFHPHTWKTTCCAPNVFGGIRC